MGGTAPAVLSGGLTQRANRRFSGRFHASVCQAHFARSVLACGMPSPAAAQYEVESEDRVWLRALLDVRLARGGEAPSWTDSGPGKTRYGGRSTDTGFERVTRCRARATRDRSRRGAALGHARAGADQLAARHRRRLQPWLIEAILRKEWGARAQRLGPAGRRDERALLARAHRPGVVSGVHDLRVRAQQLAVGRPQSRRPRGRVVARHGGGMRLGVLAGVGYGPDLFGRLLAIRGWVMGDGLSGMNSDLPLPNGTRTEVFDERDDRPAAYTWLTLSDGQERAPSRSATSTTVAIRTSPACGTRSSRRSARHCIRIRASTWSLQYLDGEARVRDARERQRPERVLCAGVASLPRDIDSASATTISAWRTSTAATRRARRGDGVTVAYLYQWGLRHRVGSRAHLAGQPPPGRRAARALAGRLATQLSFSILNEGQPWLTRPIVLAVCALALLASSALIPRAHAATVSGRVDGPDGKGIAQAVVFVESPAGRPQAAAELDSAEMDQINKTFVPGVLPIVVGTRVHFPNHDQIHHHVYSFSRTKTFELPLYKGEDAPPVLFDKPGVVKVGCNIHDWMSAIILVLPTPVLRADGRDGRYALSACRPANTRSSRGTS